MAVISQFVAISKKLLGNVPELRYICYRYWKTSIALFVGGILIVSMVASFKPITSEILRLSVPLATVFEDRSWVEEVELFAGHMEKAFSLERETAKDFSAWILEAGRRHSLEADLLAGLVLTESSFKIKAISSVGAIGPAQIRPEYWTSFCGASDLNDPAENIYCGAQVLAHFLERCGAISCALGAYNVGMHSNREHAAKRYVAKVAKHRDLLRNLML